jgi:hypothetical protein
MLSRLPIGQLDETAMQRGLKEKRYVRVLKCSYRSIKIPELKQQSPKLSY